VAIWFAASALIVGGLLLVLPLPWQLQLVIFAVLGFAAIGLWRKYRPASDTDSDQPALNRRGVHYIGQSYTLAEPLRNGSGKAQIGDSVWLVRGTDLPAGSRVKVIGVEGAVLIVEPDT
jgi:membrane protein implicated in regulation of membrane protease activity